MRTNEGKEMGANSQRKQHENFRPSPSMLLMNVLPERLKHRQQAQDETPGVLIKRKRENAERNASASFFPPSISPKTAERNDTDV